jgi:predicted acylesterase/phospholipase RssA
VGNRADLDAGRKSSDPIRILSLDGGGMRGVIPARILVELERLSGRPIAGMFDVVAGTSTGGMIALAMSKPGADGMPALTAQEVLDTYVTYGPVIFPRVALRPLRWERVQASRPVIAQRFGAVTRPRRYGNARFQSVGLEGVLKKLLGDAKLADAMADVIVPSYDWKAGRAYVFRSREAREGTGVNPSMAVVARATSAAPTYFSPLRLRVPDRELVLIDGGLVANNPASIAYYDALYRARSEARAEPDFLVVSLGTGMPPAAVPTYQELWSRNWLRMSMGMLGVMFDGTSEIVDSLLTEIITPRHPSSRYWRLNMELHGARLDLDDARPAQLQTLLELAEALIASMADDLAEMVQLLTSSNAAG